MLRYGAFHDIAKRRNSGKLEPLQPGGSASRYATESLLAAREVAQIPIPLCIFRHCRRFCIDIRKLPNHRGALFVDHVVSGPDATLGMPAVLASLSIGSGAFFCAVSDRGGAPIPRVDRGSLFLGRECHAKPSLIACGVEAA
ncbi:hypothetical protein PPMP20_04230 [Paraburkholderia phymatum]|nr:hypothetical protein [Paraburkholderia phymatum]